MEESDKCKTKKKGVKENNSKKQPRTSFVVLSPGHNVVFDLECSEASVQDAQLSQQLARVSWKAILFPLRPQVNQLIISIDYSGRIKPPGR